MALRIVAGTVSHDLKSKPLEVVLKGPVTFLPDGRMQVAVKNLADVPPLRADQDVIHPIGEPLYAQGHLAILKGNLAPEGGAVKADFGPIEAGCDCFACRQFSRAYIRHLVQADEMLGPRLLSLHNVHFLLALMRSARAAILDGSFEGWSAEWLERLSARADPLS